MIDFTNDDGDAAFDRMRDDQLTDALDAKLAPRSFTSLSRKEWRLSQQLPRFYVLVGNGDFDIIDSQGSEHYDEKYRVKIPHDVISLNDAEKYVDRLRSGETPEYYGN